MLLHVRQHEGEVATAPFPAEIAAALDALQAQGARAGGRGSRLTPHGAAPGRATGMSATVAAAPAGPAQRGADRRRLGGCGASPPAASSATPARCGGSTRSAPPPRQQRYYRSVDELPAAPDAAFIAAPNHEVPAIAAALSRRGAGGFVCFAAGFSETGNRRRGTA